MSHAETPDEEIKELYAYGAGLHSLSDIVGLDKFVKLECLSLHGNHIQRIQGLGGLPLLKELNLSSNSIKEMEGLAKLSQLQVLNLSCNCIEEIKDVQGLLALRKLLLSHNRISRLGGLSALHGPRYALQLLDLRDNMVSSLAELDVLAGCVNLAELIFSCGNHSNPACRAPAYKSAVVAAVPHILRLDGKTLCPGPGLSSMSQALSLTGGHAEIKSAGSLLPAWALQYKDDSLQHIPVQPDQARPRQVFLQPQSEASISSQYQRCRSPQPVSPLDDSSHNRPYLNQGLLYGAPAVQSKVAHSLLQHDLKASPACEVSGQGNVCQASLESAEWEASAHPETSSWVHQPSSSQMRSMSNLAHPHNQKMVTSLDPQSLGPGGRPGLGASSKKPCASLPLRKQCPTNCHTGRNSRMEIVQGPLDVPKADHSSQTNHDAWLGALEKKILDLVQQLPRVKADPQGDLIGRDDDADISYGGSKTRRVDRGDALRHRRKQNGCHSELNVVKADCSSGETSDGYKSGSMRLDGRLPTNGDSGSESLEFEGPARRWVHFGDKRKGKKLSRERNVEAVQAHFNLVCTSTLSDVELGVKLLTDLQELTRPSKNSGNVAAVAPDKKALEQLYEEVKTLQAGLASLTAMYKGVVVSEKKLAEQPERTMEIKEDEKETALCKLTRECALLESKLVNSEEKYSEERNNFLRKLESEQEARRKLQEIYNSEQEERSKLEGNLKAEQDERSKLHKRVQAEQEEREDLHKIIEAKKSTICQLEKMLQEKDMKGQEMSRKVEKYAAERRQMESFLQEKYRGKLLSLSTELISLKEALNVATLARQNAEKTLLDATTEKESSRQLALSVGQLLEEEKAKLGLSNSELEAGRSQILELREQVDKTSKDLFNAKVKNEEALEQLSKLHKHELQEAVSRESAIGERRGMLAAEKKLDHLRNAMDLKLRDAQKELQEAHDEIAKIRQDMCNLRNEKGREEATLKDTIRRVLSKEQDKEALVIELSSVVRSQKMKLQTAHFDLKRLAEAEEDVHKMHQEMIVLRLKADKCSDLAFEVESLQQKLVAASGEAERQKESVEEKFHAQIVTLEKEKKMLTEDLQKLQASEDAVKVKNKMLDSQNETIKELKLELSQAKEAFRQALKSSDALQTDWTSRLQIEINQEEVLQVKLAKQGLAMTALEEKLRFERAAKIAAENASKALQHKVAEKEAMFRYVEEEVKQVKEMYDTKLKEVGVERDKALEELEALQQEKEQLEKVLVDTQRRREELQQAAKAQGLQKAEAIEKNLRLAQALQRVAELEGELKSQGIAMETQKLVLVTKLDQLHNVWEELRQGN